MAIYISDSDGNLTKYTGSIGSDAIVTELNKKLNLDVVARYPIDTYQSEDGTQWATYYNDGWKECGGIMAGSTATTTFPNSLTFSSKNYTLVLTAGFDEASSSAWVAFEYPASRTNNSFKWKIMYVSGMGMSANSKLNYYACGY